MGIQEKIFMSVAQFLYSFTLGAYHIISDYKNFYCEFSCQKIVSFSLCSFVYFLTISVIFLLNYTTNMYGVNTLCCPLPTSFLSL